MELPLIVEVDNVLSVDECREWIEKIDELGPALAPISTLGGPQIRTDIRNNERVIFDDSSFAEQVFLAAKDQLPEDFDGWTIAGANERFRCYRYRPGTRFAPHGDGSFERNDDERSFYSYLVYLNGNFEGGNTTFLTEPEVSIRPRAGAGLLFQHPIFHEGSVVTAGTKYVARTDIMYRRLS